MANSRRILGYHRIDASDVSMVGDASIVVPVLAINGWSPTISPQVGLAVALTNLNVEAPPQVGLGVAGLRLFGKLMQVELDGVCTVQHEGFMYFPFVTGALEPIVGQSVSVDGAGKVQRSAAVSAANQVSTLTMTGSASSGTFTVTFDGQTTAPVAYTATGAQLATALNLLSNVTAGGFTGAGSAGGPLVITAAAQLTGQQLPVFTVDNTLMVAGTYASAVTTPGAEAQQAQGGGSICVGFGLNPWTPLGSGTATEVTFAIVKV